MSKSELVWGRVSSEEKILVKKVAEALGLSLSDYIRYLILKDLEARNIFNTKIEKLKEEIRNEQ